MTETIRPSEGQRRLRLLCSRRHGALTELALRLGRAPGTLSRWAQGKRRPDVDGIALLQRECGIPAESWVEPPREAGAA